MIRVLAAFVHGTLTLGHLMGMLYNYMTGNWKWFALHSAGAAASAYATYQHALDADKGL